MFAGVGTLGYIKEAKTKKDKPYLQLRFDFMGGNYWLSYFGNEKLVEGKEYMLEIELDGWQNRNLKNITEAK